MTHTLTLSLFLLALLSCQAEASAEKIKEDKKIQATIEQLDSCRDAKFQAALEMEPFYQEMNDEQKAEFGYVLFEEIYNSFRDYTLKVCAKWSHSIH